MNERQKKIPVYIFNEHNEAFYYWQRARMEGHLREAIDLFHIDAHDDMSRPQQFRASIHFRDPVETATLDYYKRFAREELTIANFIFPSVLAGLIRNVYFVYPKWRKFKPARKKFTVCSAFGEGKVLKYGIETGASADPMVKKVYSDLKHFQYFIREAARLPKNRTVLLDIDLDYFACRDSTHNQMAYELEITREQFRNKEVFLADRTLPFSGFHFDFSEREGKCFVRIKRKRGMDLFHLPPEEEVEREINSLLDVLQEKGIKPVVVTICRSCDSGYCPEEYSRFIESRLKEKLTSLFSGTFFRSR